MKPKTAEPSQTILRAILFLIAVVTMGIFIVVSADGIGLDFPGCGAVMGAVLYAVALLPFLRQKERKTAELALTAVVIAALVYARICLFYYRSPDYEQFLSRWLIEMRPLSLREAMQAQIGDYNMPYLYFLFFVSRISQPELYCIKFLSCLFDVLAAYFAMKIVSLKTDRFALQFTAFAATLACPTVLFNGAYWAQCDSMFTALCLGMLYYVLRRDSAKAVVFWALAFALKLQAIFALPFLLLGFFTRRVRLKDALWAPVAFVATLLPAVFCGRSPAHCVDIYFNQAAQYPRMSMNVPSIWSLLGSVEFDPFNQMAVFLAGAAVLVFLYLCFTWRGGFTHATLVLAFYAGALLMPYLLPRMHDRYFFLADVASLLVFFWFPKRWYVPLVTVLSSYATYRYYVMGAETLFDLKYFAVALLFVLTVVLRDLFMTLKTEAQQVGSVMPPEPLFDFLSDPQESDAGEEA